MKHLGWWQMRCWVGRWHRGWVADHGDADVDDGGGTIIIDQWSLITTIMIITCSVKSCRCDDGGWEAWWVATVLILRFKTGSLSMVIMTKAHMLIVADAEFIYFTLWRRFHRSRSVLHRWYHDKWSLRAKRKRAGSDGGEPSDDIPARSNNAGSRCQWHVKLDLFVFFETTIW